jgi:hypothetical protein
MNNLSTVNTTDITSLIGALELGDHAAGLGDNVLEASAFDFAGPRTHDFGIGCTTRISDGALEAAGASVAGPTQGAGHCYSSPRGGATVD